MSNDLSELREELEHIRIETKYLKMKVEKIYNREDVRPGQIDSWMHEEKAQASERFRRMRGE
jgi:uncharacterized protein YjcR